METTTKEKNEALSALETFLRYDHESYKSYKIKTGETAAILNWLNRFSKKMSSMYGHLADISPSAMIEAIEEHKAQPWNKEELYQSKVEAAKNTMEIVGRYARRFYNATVSPTIDGYNLFLRDKSGNSVQITNLGWSSVGAQATVRISYKVNNWTEKKINLIKIRSIVSRLKEIMA